MLRVVALRCIAFALAMLSGQRQRLSAAGGQTVRGIMGCFESWFETRSTRDVEGLLKGLESEGWKLSPKADRLAPVADLCGRRQL